MIKTVESRFFRKHEDLAVNLTAGLNVIRGPNEIGKSTLIEIVMYCLGGTSALRDSLAETVTWGHKEKELWGSTVLSLDGIDYTFTRSPAGAEVNYGSLKITGQKEVTNFAASLIGADMKTASSLMLSSQAGLLGALDEGPTAVSALMGKLADFGLIDTIVDNAQKRLALGSADSIKQKLATAEIDLAEAPDPASLDAELEDLGAHLNLKKVQHSDLEARRAELLLPAMQSAEAAYNQASQYNEARGRLERQHGEAHLAVQQTEAKLATATESAKVRPTGDELADARDNVRRQGEQQAMLNAYATFSKLAPYPEVFWDTDRESFDAEVAKLTQAGQDIRTQRAALEGEKRGLASRCMTDGKCPTCGHTAADLDHVAKHNAGIAAEGQDLDRRIAALSTAEIDGDLLALAAITKLANQRATLLQGVPSQHLIWDLSVYPAKVTWNGEPPSTVLDGDAVGALRTLEDQERKAALAEGQAQAHAQALASLREKEAELASKLDDTKVVDLAPLEQAYNDAAAVHTEAVETLGPLAVAIRELETKRDGILRNKELAAQNRVNLQARITEYTADLERLNFNNALVVKLKKLKPSVTDHLWNNVLAAVSTFFTQLRGESSMVTKDPDGFKVNGRSVDSLSGSTKDVLALAMRCALSKTFVPQASFMVLDEPCHGADEERTGNTLGFLAGVGFTQTILATHDPLSESVADNVIQLGA